MDHIEELHPVDPNTKQRFGIFDRITVKHYICKFFISSSVVRSVSKCYHKAIYKFKKMQIKKGKIHHEK